MAKKWAVFSSGAAIELEEEDARYCSHQGRCDEDVAAIASLPYVAAQLDKLGHERMARELDEYGAWSPEELADVQATRERFVWIAAGDIVEGRGTD
jgi:hypothetical protein